MIQFTSYVGASPGTTTMEAPGLGVCPPGYFKPIAPSAKASSLVPSRGEVVEPIDNNVYMPYGTESKLTGLRGLGAASRWGLFALALGLGFAGVLGYSALKRR
jgi:hypothetical protein